MARTIEMFVGVGRMVPVGVGKTGWKAVGVGPGAGWKGVEVGLALGLAVTRLKGRADALFPQPARNKAMTIR